MAVLVFAFAAGSFIVASWLRLSASGAPPEGVLAAGILLLAALAAWVAAGLALGPIKALLAAMQENREGKQGRRIFFPGHGDIESLAREFSDLADRVQDIETSMEQKVTLRTLALERKADQLRAVGEVGRQVAAVRDTDSLLKFVTAVVRGAFGYDVAAVLLRRGDELVVEACAVRDRVEQPPLARFRTGDSAPVARVISSGEAVLVSGVSTGEAIAANGDSAGGVSPLVPGLELRSELAVPIRLGTNLLGVLAVQSRSPAAFDADDRLTFQVLADQVAVALENARLFAAERQLRDLAVTEERNRLAREIHDTLAQGFMGVLLHLRAAERDLAERPAAALSYLNQAEKLATENLQEARRSVWNLRPRPLEGKTLDEAMVEEVERVRSRAAIDARLIINGHPVSAAPQVEAALLRICQEALNNVVKHSRATDVLVELSYEPKALKLRVADNGVGFWPDYLFTIPGPGTNHPRTDGAGFGLVSMADRARAAGGAARAESTPGAGTVVLAEFPV